MNAVIYEIINKETGSIYPVEKYEGGNETVTVHMLDGTVIVFDNKNSEGQLFNEIYTIREVGTHSQPDGTGTVEVVDGEVTEVGAPTE